LRELVSTFDRAVLIRFSTESSDVLSPRTVALPPEERRAVDLRAVVERRAVLVERRAVVRRAVDERPLAVRLVLRAVVLRAPPDLPAVLRLAVLRAAGDI